MASVATTLDDPCVLTCLASPDMLLYVLFGRDGEVSPSWITLKEPAQSCDHCMSQDFNGAIVLFGKKGYEIIHIKEGAIASDASAISHSAKSYSSVLFVKDWCLYCDTDSFYVSDTARHSAGDFLHSKAKVNVSSEIGPQNRLLLSKDKSVVREMHKVNTKGTDIIIVTTSKFSYPQLCVLYVLNCYIFFFLFRSHNWTVFHSLGRTRVAEHNQLEVVASSRSGQSCNSIQYTSNEFSKC